MRENAGIRTLQFSDKQAVVACLDELGRRWIRPPLGATLGAKPGDEKKMNPFE
jgi:hypothetical protein